MRIIRGIPLLIILLLLIFVPSAYAASYSYFLGSYYTNYGMVSYSVSDIDLLGFNKTHGFTQKILGTISKSHGSGSGGRDNLTLNYTVPDDGSTWQIVGTIQVLAAYSDYEGGLAGSSICDLVNVNQTVTTFGTFTGVSIGQAVNAANAASIAASNAATNASNAYNSVNNSNGNTITAVRDASGTVLSEARQAKTNSQNASTNALNAYNTTQTVNTKIDSLSTAVTNIQNNMGADISPPVVNLTTVSGASATSGNSIKIVVGVSDNISNTFTYSLNDSTYQPLTAGRIITAPLNGTGFIPINVFVKDQAGNMGMDCIVIRKI